MPRLRIPTPHDVSGIPAERILSRVEWVTDALRGQVGTHDTSDARRRRRIRATIAEYVVFYSNAVHFLQDNAMTTRTILAPGATATAKTQIRAGDLTPDGLRFYYYGVRAWMNALDRAKNKARAAANVAFLERKLAEFRAAEAAG